MSLRRAAARRLAVVATCALLTTACAGAQDAEARSVAERLLAATAGGDGSSACELLAPATRSELTSTAGTPCENAILEEDLGDGSGAATVEVFDTMAQVVVGSDTLFLSRFDGQWLVVAAACTRAPGGPYDCSIGLP